MSDNTTDVTAADLAAGAIQNRYEFVLLFDVKNGNPNGDPDAGNAPRVDPETGRGLVSDVCIKRKIRNFVTLAKTTPDGPEPGYDIYVKERAILNNQDQRGYEALGLKGKPKKGEESHESRVRRWMCQTFFDIRMFGAVITSMAKQGYGQLRGPVQLAFANSIEPIVSLEQSITRMAVTTEAASKNQDGGNRTMGRKEIVPYALYRMHGFISPHFAAQTGFSDDDLGILLTALEQMFDHDRSASRGEMSTCRLVVFKHDSKLGSAPAKKLFDLVQVNPKNPGQPPRSLDDYEITIDEANVPGGVTIENRV